jgi:hypothetical protein
LSAGSVSSYGGSDTEKRIDSSKTTTLFVKASSAAKRPAIRSSLGEFYQQGGALDFYIDDASIEALFPGKDYSRTKFTYQMSDHLPIWIQVKTDIEVFG